MKPNRQLTALLDKAEQRLDRATASVISEETLRDGTRVTRIRGAAVIEVKQAEVREYSRGRASVSEELAQTIDIDAILSGDPVDLAAGNTLASLVDSALIARYKDDISSALAARRKVYLLIAEVLSLVVRNADNTFTVLDTPT